MMNCDYPALETARAKVRIPTTGDWFQVNDGPRVSLGRRGALRRILAFLAGRPGAPTSVMNVFNNAWPGERALEKAAGNRVYVAIHALRQMGLGNLLTRTKSGYFFDADVEMITESIVAPLPRARIDSYLQVCVEPLASPPRVANL